MPRITPCRALRILILPWIVMLGLFFLLPSPVVPLSQRDVYVQQQISSQHTVITAIDYSPFRRDPHSIRTGDCYECSDLLIHWRFVAHGQILLLGMSDYDEYRKLDAAKTVTDAMEWNNKKTGAGADEEWTPYFSDPLVIEGIPTGDLGEEIAMSWFHITDQKLIHHNMHNGYTSLVVYAVVPEPGILEIWRGAFVEHLRNGTSEQAAHDSMVHHKLDTDLLASFRFLKGSDPAHVIVQHLSGSLASRTYPVRRALLVPLGPFIALPFILLSAFIDDYGPVFYFLLIWFCLLAALVGYRRMLESGSVSSYLGRLCLPFQWWRRSHRERKSRERDTWGSKGLIDEEKEIGLQPSTAMQPGWDQQS